MIESEVGKKETTISVMLLGESAVGKTALIHRFTERKFSSEFFTTIGTDFVRKEITDGDEKIIAQIWDTAGQERFTTITKSFYKQADGILLVYDVHKAETYEKLNNWIQSISSNAGSRIPKYLVANKIDLEDERQVEKAEGEKLAERTGMKYFETSARTGDNVDEVFEDIIREACAIKQVRVSTPSIVIKGEDPEGGKRKTCCH
eukprot:TRINITY_DN5623_c0_g1_i1.p1 TRINITY_DN5623_c0_g1~~TRINITY_DN5623_c0_g1_i1.p1  ORF type:complete len:204 (-),score=58.79 TRINITY_DN5623_c0_g1_i1:1334-1945(-)